MVVVLGMKKGVEGKSYKMKKNQKVVKCSSTLRGRVLSPVATDIRVTDVLARPWLLNGAKKPVGFKINYTFFFQMKKEVC